MIPLFKVFMSEDVLEPVNKLLMSGYVGQGDKVDQFEKLITAYNGNPHINTVNSATSGLHLALRMANCNVGDEVLTTPLTCFATNAPILANGYKVKWVDVDPNTCNLDLDDLERKLSPTTKAIVVVHWGGYPVDLDRLKSIQNKCQALYGHTPDIIEDCAHAWGSTYDEKRLGNHGNTAVFSFQAIKHITSVDGGCIVHPNKAQWKRGKDLRWYGLDRTKSADYRCEQNIREWGYKFHMNDLNATIGMANLIHADKMVSTNQSNAHHYNLALKNVHGVKIMKNEDNRESAYWIYTIRVKDRDNFVKMMTEKGVAVSRVHNRNDEHDCMQEFKCALPSLDELCKDMISIPCGWWVSMEDRKYITDCIKGGW
jgi:dTDP-4-amino-4,6-dideoxygalactose transaminase